MKKGIIIAFVIVIVVMLVATIGGSFYMLDYALAPDEERTDTAKSFSMLVENYPEVKPWLDSLNQRGALRDTFINRPSGLWQDHLCLQAIAPRIEDVFPRPH